MYKLGTRDIELLSDLRKFFHFFRQYLEFVYWQKSVTVVFGTSHCGQSTLLSTLVGEKLKYVKTKTGCKVVGQNSISPFQIDRINDDNKLRHLSNFVALPVCFCKRIPFPTYELSDTVIVDLRAFFNVKPKRQNYLEMFILDTLLHNPNGVRFVYVARLNEFTSFHDWNSSSFNVVNRMFCQMKLNIMDYISVVTCGSDSSYIISENQHVDFHNAIMNAVTFPNNPLKPFDQIPLERYGAFLQLDLAKPDITPKNYFRNVFEAFENARPVLFNKNVHHFSVRTVDYIIHAVYSFLVVDSLPWIMKQLFFALFSCDSTTIESIQVYNEIAYRFECDLLAAKSRGLTRLDTYQKFYQTLLKYENYMRPVENYKWAVRLNLIAICDWALVQYGHSSNLEYRSFFYDKLRRARGHYDIIIRCFVLNLQYNHDLYTDVKTYPKPQLSSYLYYLKKKQVGPIAKPIVKPMNTFYLEPVDQQLFTIYEEPVTDTDEESSNDCATIFEEPLKDIDSINPYDIHQLMSSFSTDFIDEFEDIPIPPSHYPLGQAM